jgi:hypothetical protein
MDEKLALQRQMALFEDQLAEDAWPDDIHQDALSYRLERVQKAFDSYIEAALEKRGIVVSREANGRFTLTA